MAALVVTFIPISSRSISFSCDCTLTALITASLTPSVIGDRPSPIWLRHSSQGTSFSRILLREGHLIRESETVASD